MTDTDPQFKKPRPITKKPVGVKLSFLGVRLLEAMSSRYQGTALEEKKGPLIDRLILAEAQKVRDVHPDIESILSEAGL